jgi:hypothetical protein
MAATPSPVRAHQVKRRRLRILVLHHRGHKQRRQVRAERRRQLSTVPLRRQMDQAGLVDSAASRTIKDDCPQDGKDEKITWAGPTTLTTTPDLPLGLVPPQLTTIPVSSATRWRQPCRSNDSVTRIACCQRIVQEPAPPVCQSIKVDRRHTQTPSQ